MPPRIRRRITTARREQIEQEQLRLEKEVVRPFDVFNGLPVLFKEPGVYDEVLKHPLTVKDLAILYRLLLKLRTTYTTVAPMFRLHWLRQLNYQRKMAELNREIPKDKENPALYGGRTPVLGYEVLARDLMVKLHDGGMTFGPHLFEVRMFIAKDARSDKKELEARKETARQMKEKARAEAIERQKALMAQQAGGVPEEPVTDPALSGMGPKKKRPAKKAPAKRPPPAPAAPNMQLVDNVIMILNLNAIARGDELLNALMKVVALGKADPQQIVTFQGFIKQAREMGPQPHHAYLFPGGVLPGTTPPAETTAPAAVPEASPTAAPAQPVAAPTGEALPQGMAGTHSVIPAAPQQGMAGSQAATEPPTEPDQAASPQAATDPSSLTSNPAPAPASMLPQPGFQAPPGQPYPQPNGMAPMGYQPGYQPIHAPMVHPRSMVPRDRKLTAFQEKYLTDATLVFEFVENANVRFQFPKWAVTEVIDPQTTINADENGDVLDTRDILWSFLWIHNQKEFDAYEEKLKKYNDYLAEVKKIEDDKKREEEAKAEEAKAAAEKEAAEKEEKDGEEEPPAEDNPEEEPEEAPQKPAARRNTRKAAPPKKKAPKGPRKVDKPHEPEARYTPVTFTLHGVPMKYIPMYVNSTHPLKQVQEYMEHVFKTGNRTNSFYLWYQVDGKLDELLAEDVREDLVNEEKKLPGAIDYIGKENEKKRKAKEKADLKKKIKLEEQQKELKRLQEMQPPMDQLMVGQLPPPGMEPLVVMPGPYVKQEYYQGPPPPSDKQPTPSIDPNLA